MDIQAQQIIDDADEALIRLSTEQGSAEEEPSIRNQAPQSPGPLKGDVPTGKKDDVPRGTGVKENVRPRRDMN